MSLLGLANQTLTTPALRETIDRFPDRIPEDVRIFVREMYDRNVVRNDRLAAQLAEAVEALNGAEITPLLVKGAATLATAPREQWASKLMTDLDVIVPPDQTGRAMSALFAIGYRTDFEAPPGGNKWYADLRRPDDAGMIDLHCQLPGPAFFYQASGDWMQHSRLKQIEHAKASGQAYVLSATYQALMLMIHDQFQDSDYWTGNIDVRHLLDLRDLAQSAEGIDWDALVAFTPNKLARNALETQLVGLSSLLGVNVPEHLRRRFIPRLQFKRRMTQARYPLLRRLLLPVAVLDYRSYRTGLGPSHVQDPEAGRRRWTLPRRHTLRFLLSLTRDNRVGKV
jgi:hypothetical protein